MIFQRVVPPHPSIDIGHRFQRAPHVASTRHGAETILLDVKRERYHTLNDVGTRIWELLAGGATLSTIVEVIRKEYEVPTAAGADQLEQDVTLLLKQLYGAGLLVSVQADA
ncbi:MAG TPA: PqqD family protein [Vicinamibacterales bacterium]|jgi:hypothetical protein|nr:PqqD family protein [Vicinamibacterales bacterium]